MINIKLRIVNLMKAQGYQRWKTRPHSIGLCDILEQKIDDDHWNTCTIYNRFELVTSKNSDNTYTRHILSFIFNDEKTGLFAPRSSHAAELIIYYTVYHSPDGDNIVNINRGIIADYTKDKKFRPILNNIRVKLIDDDLVSWNDI